MLIRSLEQGTADALASGFRAHVELFDAGELAARRDVRAVRKNGYAECSPFRPDGENLKVSALDCLSQVVSEILGYGLAIPEGFFQERQGLGQPCCGDHLDPTQRSMAWVVILAAAWMALSISSSPTSRCVHKRT